ncbi:hypothetical protein R5R33_01965 [Microbulbifer pacificus]|uniref:Uncharacterized protein n=1 Tax=Microbulbifer pacificus TaxID=407164 RepID=A0AAU0N2X8_9GAMM|nr:hypothetical protein [Microbulbifer pacificus]WOX05944.1 hypothetical protein R5R33_01965 [Microbulbifer pacificus]
MPGVSAVPSPEVDHLCVGKQGNIDGVIGVMMADKDVGDLFRENTLPFQCI